VSSLSDRGHGLCRIVAQAILHRLNSRDPSLARRGPLMEERRLPAVFRHVHPKRFDGVGTHGRPSRRRLGARPVRPVPDDA